MRKGLGIGVAVFIGLAAIGSLLPNAKPSTTPASASATATPTVEPSPTLTPNPEMSKDTLWPTPELYVDDLGEDSCSKFEVCTFVNIEANATCKNAEIYIDLFDDNDEYYDTEAVSVGTIKKGAKLRGIEVGTDDTDAAYVEANDYLCG